MRVGSPFRRPPARAAPRAAVVYNPRAMRYRLFGPSGLRVSELCLGTMTFGNEWGWGASREESRAMFDAFAAAGGNFIDTANRYTEGTSETYVGELVGSDREHWVVATKYTLYTRKGDPNAAGNQRKNMVQALEGSLRRLGTDYVDVYWVHAWDFLTPVEEVMRGLDDLVRAGKVLYVGISDAPAWVVAQANTLADLKGWSCFTGLQIQYSLIERTVERELLPMARQFRLAVTAWAPLSGGLLSGKYSRKNRSGEEGRLEKLKSAKLNERNLAIADAVQQVADEVGRSSSQVAINWVRQQEGNIIPILGGTRPSQIEDNLGSLEFELTREQLDRLSEASKIELGFPHDFLSTPSVRELVYGGTYDQIVKDRS
jgi:aryl-alcohol dehydrogenase-like predicted oxidoreductase